MITHLFDDGHALSTKSGKDHPRVSKVVNYYFQRGIMMPGMSMFTVLFCFIIALFPRLSFAGTIESYTCPPGFTGYQKQMMLGTIKLPVGERSYFYGDDKGCPYNKSCRQKAFIVSGDGVLVGKVEDGWSCVLYRSKTRDFVGWMPSKNINIVREKQDVDISSWLGTWKHYDDDGHIKISRLEGNTLKVEGRAFWYGGRGIVHDGGIDGSGTVIGNSLFASEGGEQYTCQITMKLLGNYLIATDNNFCGGMNVRFNNVYAKVAGSAPSVKSKQTDHKSPPDTFTSKNACPGEGCFFGRWRVKQDVAFVESIGNKKIVATMKKNDHVTALTGEVQGKAAVVAITKDHEHFEKGEIIYVLDYIGEGYNHIWRKGHDEIDPYIDEALNEGKTDWSKQIRNGVSEWWVQFDLGGGKLGWAKGENFAGHSDNDVDIDDPEVCWEFNKQDSPDNVCRKSGLPSPKESKAVCSGMISRGYLSKEDCAVD